VPSRAESYELSVPATSANLGPGFDAVGLALELRMRARVAGARAFELRFEPGSEAPSHDGLHDAIVAAMRRVDERLPKIRIDVSNEIPLGKGLGSSAAAGVLGLAVALRSRDGAIATRQLARLACELEGHPDNALPAIYGGAVIAASAEPGAHVRLRLASTLRALVVVPGIDFPTGQARALLPRTYARGDVVFTAQRAALLGAALATGSWAELGEAMHDRLHQPYRVPHIPGMAAALGLRERGVIGTALSGAGPSLIALLRPGTAPKRAAAAFEACFANAGILSRALSLRLAARGLVVAVGD